MCVCVRARVPESVVSLVSSQYSSIPCISSPKEFFFIMFSIHLLQAAILMNLYGFDLLKFPL